MHFGAAGRRRAAARVLRRRGDENLVRAAAGRGGGLNNAQGISCSLAFLMPASPRSRQKHRQIFHVENFAGR